MRAADPPAYDAPAERLPGQFARHARTGAPIVAHPTDTTKHTGNKADLIGLCAQRGIAVPDKVTVAQLHGLLGPRPTRVQYGRPSSLGKQIENMTNIQKWSERAVALGLWLELRELLADQRGDYAEFAGRTARGNLFELANVDPTTLDDADAKELLDRVAVRAKNTAQAGLAADRGTHHHELTEDHDNEQDWVLRSQRGEDLGVPVHVQAALVEAWSRMLAEFDIEILATEATCVDDQWRQAGTLDRICRLNRDLRFITTNAEYVTLPAGWVGILDIKTGKLRLDRSGFVSYWHGYSVQLASYAQAVPYDPDNDQRGAWPWPIDQQWAIIAHLDVLAALEGEAVCRLVLVDLAAGRHAGALCVASREWEARCDVFSIPTDDLAVRVPVTFADEGGVNAPEGTSEPSSAPLAVSAPDTSLAPLRAGPSNTPTTAAEPPTLGADTATIAPPQQVPAPAAVAEPAAPASVCAVEQPTAAGVSPQAPAAVLSPLRQAQADRARQNAEADAKRRLHQPPGEGDDSDASTFASVEARYRQLDAIGQEWIKSLAKAADAAQRPFGARETYTARRFGILTALVHLARDEARRVDRSDQTWFDETARALLYAIIGDVALFPTVPLGHLIGSLNATEADTFAGLCTGRLAIAIDDTGTQVVAA